MKSIVDSIEMEKLTQKYVGVSFSPFDIAEEITVKITRVKEGTPLTQLPLYALTVFVLLPQSALR